MHLATFLRRDLAERAHKYAQAKSLPYCLSYGETPIVCFEPFEDNSRHGNFLPASYLAIRSNQAWEKRLEKIHTTARRALPVSDRGRWRELDSCTSSDALLMNVFCYPEASCGNALSTLLGVAPGAAPCFGYKARVPLCNGRYDRTEVDLRFGDLLIEAKLTEGDFQRAAKNVVFAYRDFLTVFDPRQLPQTEDEYLSYQLLRNVLAAYSQKCSFCLLVDARRPDLIDAWYAVMSCVKPVELRTQLRIATWQEIATAAPPKLRAFLATKYGIEKA